MKNNEYYIPNVNEFEIGFEFEFRYNEIDSDGKPYKGKWKKRTLQYYNCGWSMEAIEKFINDGNIRARKK